MADAKASKIDQTLKRESIDEDYIARVVSEAWQYGQDDRDAYLARRSSYETAWRDLTGFEAEGPWENSANFKPPHILTFGKAVHARLWQLFSNPQGFFSTKARKEVFQDKEAKVQEFMNFVLTDYANSKHGIRREIDRWLWDIVFNGSGYLKCYWKREEREYSEVQTVAEVEKETIYSIESPTGRTEYKSTVKEKEVNKTEVIETPQVKRIVFEDIVLPIGEHDPQDSSWVATRVFLTDEDMKVKVQQGKFFKEAVEESIKFKEHAFGDTDEGTQLKRDRNVIDGHQSQHLSEAFNGDRHCIYEWYGKAYITKEFNEEVESELSELPKEIVAWVHKGSGRVLGWTYLSRVSPGGIRPIFKADYVTFPDRSHGVGVPELLYENQRLITALTNMRIDNGTLASTPMFAYRAASGLKPGNWRIKPGQGLAVDDVNDIKPFTFPFLTGFGQQEEASIYSLSERLIALSDLNLGIAPQKVGALRNATGSNLLASESSIQLEIHFDRIADCMTKMLQFLFRLCRERIPSELYYRVTGDTGSPIFGKVDRENLKGDYDFIISIDILGQSSQERQQLSTLMLNTFMNPAFMQTGVVTSTNLYNLGKNFLRAYKAPRIDDLISKPQDYQGERLSSAERIFRIVVGQFDSTLPDTITLDENHMQAIAAYEAFQNSPEFGLLTTPEQLEMFKALIDRHMQMNAAQNAPGNPNVTGFQIPREGLGPTGAPQQGAVNDPLLQTVGQANGPVF
jgi:hypothetical protein